MPPKTAIYTWRVTQDLKARLEDRAHTSGRSVAQLLDDLVARGLDLSDQDPSAEVERQRRLHARARPFAGCIAGGDASRSRRVRELVRARLKARRRGR